MWVPNLADVAWMTDALSRHAASFGLTGAVTAVQLLDARMTHPHRPESPLCSGWATYVVTTRDSSPTQLYVKGFSGDGAAEVAWRQDRAATPVRQGRHLPELDLLVWRFPGDPQLATLPALVDPRLATRILPAAVCDVLDLQSGDDLRTTVVRYQPETSATLRLDVVDRDGAPTVFAKHLSDGNVGEVAARHHELWSTTDQTGALHLAQPLAADPARGVLWTRGVPGGPLSEVTPAELPEVTAPLGSLLAALHRSPVEVPGRVTVDGLLAEMRKKAKKLVRAHP